MFVVEKGRCLCSAATESRNASSKPGISAWEDAALMLLWLKEAQSHIQVCSQGSHSRGSRAPRSCLAMGCVGHRARDVLVDALGCFAEAWARTPDSLQLCRGRPHVPSGFCPLAGHAQSSRCYKYPGTGLPAGPAGAGGLLKPSGLSCQLTLCVHESPLCALSYRNPPIPNVSKTRREQQTPSVH